ncbi:purine permease [Acinetobacter sp. B5B]|uniref:uracil-xanthine permease family protein n=1 Tax=Acinetobacter baretiae TaxID=2605383 RepID=UPI0018C25552|nr:nucleobase:cation symporter-2 family protein [Acinetobacter baretiae]MBF7683195.1 purine permease [Acinetobacter baretiae]
MSDPLSSHKEHSSELIIHLDERPKASVTLLAALQHLFAILVPILTPGLLICGALKVPAHETTMILSMSLVISGIATFLQCKKVGPLGAGLLIVQGTSFNFIGPIMAIGSLMIANGTPYQHVMAAIFGVVIAGAFIEMGVSQILPWIKKLITPLVTGVVVLLIGLTLVKEGLISMGGGYGAMADGSFANGDNLLMSCFVLTLIILLNRTRIIWLKSASLFIALIAGYILAGLLGHLNFDSFYNAPTFQVPSPLHFGISFDWSLFIPLAFIYLVTSLEAIGDITATSKVSQQPVSGPVWMQRIKGGVLVNGVNSFIAGIFNTFPSSVFAQNNGVIQITGVASRYVGLFIAAMLVILGLFPKIAGIIQAVPQAVLGGAVIVMFGAVAASGINILASIKLDRRALLIIAVALALGLGISQVPDFLKHMPELMRNIFSSGVATGGIAALILNIVLPENNE